MAVSLQSQVTLSVSPISGRKGRGGRLFAAPQLRHALFLPAYPGREDKRQVGREREVGEEGAAPGCNRAK